MILCFLGVVQAERFPSKRFTIYKVKTGIQSRQALSEILKKTAVPLRGNLGSCECGFEHMLNELLAVGAAGCC